MCAFYFQDTNFLKYIVETLEGNAVFPSFVFETTQRGGFLDENRSSSDLDILFEKSVINYVKTFFIQNGGDAKPNVSMKYNDSIAEETGDELSPQQVSQQELEKPLDDVLQTRENYTQQKDTQNALDDTQQQETQNTIDDTQQQETQNTIDDTQQQDTQNPLDDTQKQQEFDKPLDDVLQIRDNETSQEDTFQDQFDEILSEPENAKPEDISVISYIGYIMCNNEPYVFVNIGSMKQLAEQFKETILNELFHTFKVFDTDVDKTIRDVFDNNRWLLNDDQPYSGYMCKLNKDNKLVNVTLDDNSTDLINVESIGDYYYFSFLPLDPQQSATYKRFAIFPEEYVCILDDNQMSQYKSNKMSYAQDKTIYFKGETLTDKKSGNEFMCVKTPSQFTQY